jgi:penicillin-binding protein 2
MRVDSGVTRVQSGKQISRIVFIITLLSACAFAGGRPDAHTTVKKKSGTVVESATVRVKHRRHRRRHYQHYLTSAFVSDNTLGDVYAGEDPVVRGAAIDALGNYNGTIVAINPENGRILAMVNQKLALSEGAEPCSTIKLSVALAALSEGIVDKDTVVRLSRRSSMNMTEALAVSNNAYFESLGRRLGFKKVAYYSHQFGLGELAGWHMEGEHLGLYPKTELSAKKGGVGRMCSFGESISMTPLQLGALVSAIANGGTLYYLQHPASLEDAANFQPKVKRQLDIGSYIPQLTDGMAGAVDYGTARSLHENFIEEPIFGKTGTCSSKTTRFGWFGSYANTQYGKIVVVIFLQGDRKVFGPKAAEVAGRMYRNLYDHSFFAGPVVPKTTAAGAPQ